MQTIFGSHGAIAPFQLVRPATINDAAAALADGAGACLAGGVDLLPALRAGRRVNRVVYLGGIHALKAVSRTDRAITIGAGVTHHRLANDPEIARTLPDLAGIWRNVANVRVRHAATIGGNLMARNPQYDALPALQALGARLIFAGADGRAQATDAGAADWPDGLLSAVEIPLVERRFGFDRSMKPALSLAVSLETRDGKLGGRAAVGCAHQRPVCLALDFAGARDWGAVAARADAIADAFAADLTEPDTDWIASGGYRSTLARVLLARQLTALARR